jgi:hypothetical protein
MSLPVPLLRLRVRMARRRLAKLVTRQERRMSSSVQTVLSLVSVPPTWNARFWSARHSHACSKDQLFGDSRHFPQRRPFSRHKPVPASLYRQAEGSGSCRSVNPDNGRMAEATSPKWAHYPSASCYLRAARCRSQCRFRRDESPANTFRARGVVPARGEAVR